MPSAHVSPLPPGSLLGRYAAEGAFTDCYALEIRRRASLAEFMAAFYTTPVFRLERWILARALGLPSTDEEARALARGSLERFAAWHVEAREPDQALLAAGRTRSWLRVIPHPATPAQATILYFGSAVVPRRDGARGSTFSALLAFHKLYSRVLLDAAGRRLGRGAE